MRMTNLTCNTCGQPLFDVAGFGEGQKLLCNNSACLTHFKHVKCPKCSRGVINVRILGLGHQMFQCENGHQWDSLKRQISI